MLTSLIFLMMWSAVVVLAEAGLMAVIPIHVLLSAVVDEVVLVVVMAVVAAILSPSMASPCTTE